MPTHVAEIASLFPEASALRMAEASDWEAPLVAGEVAIVARAVAKRRREFAAGRACARDALSTLGGEAGALPRDPDRVPVWPQGFVGSISHCDDACGAVVARASDVVALGFDVEGADALPTEVIDTVLGPAERDRAQEHDRALGRDWAKLVWSAKESFYKAYFPRLRHTLEFHDAEVQLAGPGQFQVRLVDPSAPSWFGRREIEGRFVYRERLLYTGVFLEASDAGASEASG
ncbi:MAG: 4'-phosphopantetheinyl transferase superfamily protein [Myxococcota bacterium]